MSLKLSCSDAMSRELSIARQAIIERRKNLTLDIICDGIYIAQNIAIETDFLDIKSLVSNCLACDEKSIPDAIDKASTVCVVYHKG